MKEISFEAASCVAFDYSGMYLAIAGRDALTVVAPKKQYESVLTISKLPKGGASTMAWMRDATGLWVGGLKDHTLKLLK